MSAKTRFEKRLQHLSLDLWTKIAKIDEFKGQWIAGLRLSPYTLGYLTRSVLVTSTGASTRIEGARLSEEDIEKLMRGIDIQKFSDRDAQEVQGYFELLENLFNSWKFVTFSESTIKHFHKELLKYTEKDELHRGEYKKRENKVQMINAAGKSIGLLFDTTKAYLTPKEMQELVEWTSEAFNKKKIHPLLIIANFIIEFLQIHPFQDGNGRLSRILTNLLLLKSGYAYIPYVSHEKLIEDNKPDYYMALKRSQKTFTTAHENIDTWLEFFINIFLKQSEMAIELLTHEQIEKILSTKQLEVWKFVQSVHETSPCEIAKHTKVARPTINQILVKLIRLKKIERIGLGRSTRYRKL